jgi:hypothetical protein
MSHISEYYLKNIQMILDSSKNYLDPLPEWAINASRTLMLQMFPDEFCVFFRILLDRVSLYDLELIMKPELDFN